MPANSRGGLRRLGRYVLKAAGKVIATPVRRQLRRFEQAAYDPQGVQEALLKRILQQNAATDFGRDHGFRQIRSLGDFRRQIPVAAYEYFEPYIARMRKGQADALVAHSRVHMFALTSGTTAARKFIPVTDQYLADYRRGWNLWGLRSFRDHPEIKLRPIVQLSSDWEEFHTEAGIPCGSVTGLTATMQKRIIRWLYLVPACVGKVKDAGAKQYLVLRLSIPHRPGMIIAANPSTLINLARAGDQAKESLIRDLYNGTLAQAGEYPPSVVAALSRRLRRRHRERARELEAIVERTGRLYPRDYWSTECLLGNWTGGSMGMYLRHYPQFFGAQPVREVGLIASEGRMTIPLVDNSPSGVLDITSHYFEFIPEAEMDRPQPTVLGAHELQVGQSYYILPTTAFGLYRYDIHDLVRVTGFYHRTPLLEFLSKGSSFANLTGEKLSEYHVTQTMVKVLHQLDLNLTAYSVAPCWDDRMPYYGLFLERGDLTTLEAGHILAERLDQGLQAANIEYAAKRQSLRLGPLQLKVVPTGTWVEWDRNRLARSGGTPEQYKHPCLIGDPQFAQTMPILPIAEPIVGSR